MDKLERLLNLTAALLHADRPLTADDLRDRVGGYPDAKASFRRAFTGSVSFLPMGSAGPR